MSQIKDGFAKLLTIEMKSIGISLRELARNTFIPEIRIEDFINQNDLPNKMEAERLAKQLNVEYPIFRVAVENSQPKETPQTVEVLNLNNNSHIKPVVDQKVSKEINISKLGVLKTGPARLTSREALFFQRIFVDAITGKNYPKILKELDLPEITIYKYRNGIQAPYRKRALAILETILKFQPKDENLETLHLQFRSAVSYAIDRSGSIKRVAAHFKVDPQTIRGWQIGKCYPKKSSLENYINDLNNFYRGSMDAYPKISAPAIEKPVVKYTKPVESNNTNQSKDIDYSAPIIATVGSKNLLTLERERFTKCINHVINIFGKKYVFKVAKINQSRLDRYRDTPRTIARREAIQILKRIQPLAMKQKPIINRNFKQQFGKITCSNYQIKLKSSKKACDNSVESTQPNIINKTLTVLDYKGERRNLTEWVHELLTFVDVERCVFGISYETEPLTASKISSRDLNKIFDEIKQLISNTNSALDIKFTVSSTFNDTLMVHFLRYIKMT